MVSGTMSLGPEGRSSRKAYILTKPYGPQGDRMRTVVHGNQSWDGVAPLPEGHPGGSLGTPAPDQEEKHV